MKKTKKTVLFTLCTIATIFLINIGYQFYTAVSESMPLSFKPPNDYKDLFLKQYQKKFNSYICYNSKVRHPILTFDFKNEYNIVVFKLPITGNASLLEVIKELLQKSSSSNGTIYTKINQTNYDLECKSGSHGNLSSLYLALKGDSIKTIVKTDSVVSYSFDFESFSLKYGLNDDVDIFASCKKQVFLRSKPVPVNLLFLKRNKNIYFLILTANNSNKSLSNNVLYSLIACAK